VVASSSTDNATPGPTLDPVESPQKYSAGPSGILGHVHRIEVSGDCGGAPPGTRTPNPLIIGLIYSTLLLVARNPFISRDLAAARKELAVDSGPHLGHQASDELHAKLEELAARSRP
jgi:hypothetical protein